MHGKLAIYRRLLGYLRPYPSAVALAYGGMLVATLLNLAVPQLLKFAIDQGLADDNPSALFWAGVVIMLIAVVRAGAGYLQRFYGEWLTFRAAYDLRNDFYQAVQHLPFAFHDRAHTGDLMSRATGDIGETERFVGIGLMELVAVVALGGGVIVAMFLMNAQLALLTLPSILLLIYMAVRFGRVVKPKFQEIQQQMGIVSTIMQESLTGINLVKAFAREDHEFAKFDAENEDWLHRRVEVIRTWGAYWPTFTLILAAGVFLLLWVGGPLAMSGAITAGTLFAMISYLLMLNAPAQQLGNLINLAANAGASSQRVFEIVDTPTTIVEQRDAVNLDNIRGAVSFEQVSFAYAGASSVLHGIDFDVAPGQTVALVGPTGSGKSSIVSLLPRFYDPSAGVVRIDGVDVRTVTLHSLRRHIGVVLQNPFLFSATIAENIAYGIADADEAAIEAAARAANAHDFVTRFPHGYATHVGERGVTLSGGQRQRIAIARALLYDPRILILDDSTSSVDTETEHLIQQALTTLMRNRTTFIIAQRLLTLKNADLILVLEQGQIVQRGAHKELLAQGGAYRQIYDMQLRDQEAYLQTA